MTTPVDPFTAIEDAAVAAVKVATQGKTREVDSISPQWSEDMLKQVLNAAPAVFIAITGGTNGDPGAETALLSPSVSAIVVTKAVKNEKDGRRGVAKNIGAYQLIFPTIWALHALKVDGVGELQFKSLDPVDVSEWNIQGAAIYEASFDVTQFAIERPAPEVLNPFETLNVHWKDSGAAGDEDPDIATDIISIEQDEE